MAFKCFGVSCCRTFADSDALQEHLSLKHFAYSPYQCQHCLTFEATELLIVSHLRQQHQGREIDYRVRKRDDIESQLMALLKRSHNDIDQEDDNDNAHVAEGALKGEVDEVDMLNSEMLVAGAKSESTVSDNGDVSSLASCNSPSIDLITGDHFVRDSPISHTPVNVQTPRSTDHSNLKIALSQEKQAAKYRKFFFDDREAFDIPSILAEKLGQAEADRLLRTFTQEFYCGSFKAAGRNTMRQVIIRACAHYLIDKQEKSDEMPSVRQKALMAFSIWKCFPFLKEATDSDDDACPKPPYLLIYDPVNFQGWLRNCIANKNYNMKPHMVAVRRERRQEAQMRKFGMLPKESPKMIAKEPLCSTGLDEEAGQQLVDQLIHLGDPSNNPETHAKVVSLMEETRAFRLAEIKNGKLPTATAVFNRYPRLIDTAGMILADFEAVAAPSKDARTRSENWKIAADFLVRDGFGMITGRKEGIHLLYKQFQVYSVDDIDALNSGDKCCLAICILPYILKPMPTRIPGKRKAADSEESPKNEAGFNRFSSAMAVRSLIEYRPISMTNLAVVASLLSDSSDERRHPLLVAKNEQGKVGRDGGVGEWMVLVDDVAIPVQPNHSTVALQLLFATFFAFRIDYPSSLRLCYHFLEIIFGVKVADRRLPNSVKDLYSRIQQTTKFH